MRDTAPDIVLLDMNLPVKDGWTTCREVREDPATADLRIIALTAHAMGEDRDRALEAGCDDFATKPIDFPELLAKIHALARKGRCHLSLSRRLYPVAAGDPVDLLAQRGHPLLGQLRANRKHECLPRVGIGPAAVHQSLACSWRNSASRSGCWPPCGKPRKNGSVRKTWARPTDNLNNIECRRAAGWRDPRSDPAPVRRPAGRPPISCCPPGRSSTATTTTVPGPHPYPAPDVPEFYDDDREKLLDTGRPPDLHLRPAGHHHRPHHRADRPHHGHRLLASVLLSSTSGLLPDPLHQ